MTEDKKDVLIVTLPEVPGHKITKIFGYVSSEDEEGIVRQAQKLGANAVVDLNTTLCTGFRKAGGFDGGDQYRPSDDYSCYANYLKEGTAVKIEPETPQDP